MSLTPLLALGFALAVSAPPPAGADGAPPAAQARQRLLVFDVRPTGGVSPDTAENLTGLIAALVAEDPRLEVLAGPDLRALMDLEGSRQALGCDADASCLAEVAGALDANLLLSAQLGQLGNTMNLNMSLYDRQRSENIARGAVQGASIDGVVAKLRPAVGALLTQGLGSPTPQGAAASTAPDQAWPWVSAGVALLAGGAVAGSVGVVIHQVVLDEKRVPIPKHLGPWWWGGTTAYVVGGACLIGGAAALVAGGAGAFGGTE